MKMTDRADLVSWRGGDALKRIILLCLVLTGMVLGCDDDDATPSDGALSDGGDDAADGSAADAADGGGLAWYLTCGDPVCTDEVAPTRTCTADPGAACTDEDALCEPGTGCGVQQLCTTSDPTTQGCPVSAASKKQEIEYLDPAALDSLAAQLLSVRLATYRYVRAPAQERLGFIIDDAPGEFAVLPSQERVDLYGYTSMAVATIQRQDARLRTLEARLAALESACPVVATP